MFKNVSPESVFSLVRQDLSVKFGCLVLSGQKTCMFSLVEPYYLLYSFPLDSKMKINCGSDVVGKVILKRMANRVREIFHTKLLNLRGHP